MTDSFILAIAVASVPTMITVLIGILINNVALDDLNSRLDDFRDHMGRRFDQLDHRFEMMEEKRRRQLHRVSRG